MSNEVTPVCTTSDIDLRSVLRYLWSISTSTVYTDANKSVFSNEVTEDSKAVSGYDEQTRCVHATVEYIVGKREKKQEST